MKPWGWLLLGLLVLSHVLMGLSMAHGALINPKLAKVCRGEGYPNTWAAKGGPPAWVTEARLDALCAVTAWLREDLGVTVEPEDG